MTDAKGRTVEGGYVFVVRGERDLDARDFRFDKIELVPDKKEYRPGDTVRLMVNTHRAGSCVVLFLRPTNGVYPKPKVLREMGLDLKAIQEKRTNLNAQEIGNDAERARQWKQLERNSVFDEILLADMVKAGVDRLTSMQNPDGGRGWFSGWKERSWPYTTAVIVNGLQTARDNGVALVPGVLEHSIQWLQQYQAEQVQRLKDA